MFLRTGTEEVLWKIFFHWNARNTLIFLADISARMDIYGIISGTVVHDVIGVNSGNVAFQFSVGSLNRNSLNNPYP
jgi:hypothetical protein